MLADFDKLRPLVCSQLPPYFLWTDCQEREYSFAEVYFIY